MKFNPQVDDFLRKKNHPLHNEIQRVREIILATDDRIEEAIKWSSPTFIYKGNIASYFMNAKSLVSLMFHKGALIPKVNDLLEGDGKEARVARFLDLKDVEKKKKALEEVVRAWISMQDGIK